MASFLNNIFGSPDKKYNIKLDKTFNKDPLAWSRALVRHHCGKFSIAAVQANMDMEDQSLVEVGTNALFVGVYDGHKGKATAIYIREHILGEILRCIQQNINSMNKYFFKLAMETILRQGVAEMERGFIGFARNSLEQQNQLQNSFQQQHEIQHEIQNNFEQQHEIQNSFVSSGCLICIIWRGTLFVANVGDSRAILGSHKGIGPLKRLVVKQMVRDHNFLNSSIQQELAELHTDHYNRSLYESIEDKGLIETSRCIGNAYMKTEKFTQRRPSAIPMSEAVTPTYYTFPLISSQPEVCSRVLKNTDRFIIFGSGGFWKLISNEDAAKVVNTSPRDRIAERLVTLALEKGAAKGGKTYRDLIKIPKSNCVSGNNGNQNNGFRSAYHDDITVIVVYLDKRPNREGVRPGFSNFYNQSSTIRARQSEFTNFYNNANA
ncbi:probable protein phosphatase 2C 43 [Trifolium pratense]|uniref:probable protein phosphatase 2C 43 n=1 Tax=Trifolium pratense TaxID=57577 RepID=UPI001E6973D3|nr:probable protein phosphatase 2C 43 [Trifolium pratense]